MLKRLLEFTGLQRLLAKPINTHNWVDLHSFEWVDGDITYYYRCTECGTHAESKFVNKRNKNKKPHTMFEELSCKEVQIKNIIT